MATHGGSPCKNFTGKGENFDQSSKTGVSPGNFFLGLPLLPTSSLEYAGGSASIDNQQLSAGPQTVATTEETLRFTKVLKALGECTTDKHDRLFATGMRAYGHPRNSSSRCPNHLNSAPPELKVTKDK